MLTFPDIDPVIFSIGPLSVSWYSMSYVVGILLGLIVTKKLAHNSSKTITSQHLDDFVVWIIIAIIIGGRAGYVLIYDPIKYLSDPIEILKTYKGGMSFHGGLTGFIIAAILFSWKNKLKLLSLTDLCAIAAPIPIFLGRIANFINSELYGRITDVPWAFIFPYSDGYPRHPSQLYESFTEGLLLFLILLYFATKTKAAEKPGLLSGIFLIFYGIFRIIIEFFREPDIQIGFIIREITMGQLLSIPLIILGIGIIFYGNSKK